MPPKAPPPTPADEALLRGAFDSCKDGAIGALRGSEANAYRTLLPLLSPQFLQGMTKVDGANQRVKRWFYTEKARRAEAGEPLPADTDAAAQAQLWARAEAARPAFQARFAAAGAEAAQVEAPSKGGAGRQSESETPRPSYFDKDGGMPPGDAIMSKQELAGSDACGVAAAAMEKQERALSFREVTDPTVPPGAVAYECSFDRWAQLGFDNTRPRFFRLVVLNNSQLIDVATNHPRTYGGFKKFALPTFMAYVHEQYSLNADVDRFVIGKFVTKGDVLASATACMRMRSFYTSSDNLDRAGYMWLYDSMTILTPELPDDTMLMLEQELIMTFVNVNVHSSLATGKCMNQRDDLIGVGGDRFKRSYVYVVSRSAPYSGRVRAAKLKLGGSGGADISGAKRQRAAGATLQAAPTAMKPTTLRKPHQDYWDLVISYVIKESGAEKDKYVTLLQGALEARGYTVFLCESEIRGGDDFVDLIAGSICGCRCFIAVLSPSYGVKSISPWTLKEAKLAGTENVETGKPRIQLLRHSGEHKLPAALKLYWRNTNYVPKGDRGTAAEFMARGEGQLVIDELV